MNEYTVRKILITPEKAKELLKNNYKDNRSIKYNTLTRYTKDMKNGNWYSEVCAPITISNKGNLIDGQHRLLALIAADVSIMFEIREGVDEELYKYFDQGTKRQVSDAFSNEKSKKNVAAMCRKIYVMSKVEEWTPTSLTSYERSSGVTLSDDLLIYENMNDIYPGLFNEISMFAYNKEIRFSRWTPLSASIAAAAMYMTDKKLYEKFKQIVYDKKSVQNSVISYKRWANLNDYKGCSAYEKIRITWNATTNIWNMLCGYPDKEFRNIKNSQFKPLIGFDQTYFSQLNKKL